MRVTSYQGIGEHIRLLGRVEDAERYFWRAVEALDRLGRNGVQLDAYCGAREHAV